MNLFSIYDQLRATDHLLPFMAAAGWSLVAAIGTLTLSFSFMRVAVLGSVQDPFMWGARFLLVIGLLSAYNPVNEALIEASQSLTGMFIDKAGWSDYWATVATQFVPFFEDPAVESAAAASASGETPPSPSTFDRMVGMVKAGFLTRYVSIAYAIQFLAFEYVTKLAILLFTILRLLGPIMIAAGLLADGKSLRQWFGSTVQVLLWPVIPALCMAITVGTRGSGVATDNVVFTIIQSLVLALMAIATPFIVAFMLGKGGIAVMAGALVGVALGAAKGLYGAVAGEMRAAPGLGASQGPQVLQARQLPGESGALGRPGERAAVQIPQGGPAGYLPANSGLARPGAQLLLPAGRPPGGKVIDATPFGPPAKQSR